MNDGTFFNPDFWNDATLEDLEAAIISGLDIDAKDDHGRTALHMAVERQAPPALVQLLGHGARANVRDDRGETPLHRAGGLRNQLIVSLLLRHDADVDAHDSNGQTPLFYAVNAANIRGNSSVVSTLLESGANPNARDSKGATPILYAAQRGDLEATELLLAHGADVRVRDSEWRSLFHYAALRPLVVIGEFEGQFPLVKQAVESLADDLILDGFGDFEGRTPLHYAVAIRDLPLTKWLLEHGADSGFDAGYGLEVVTPLHFVFLTDWYLGDDERSIVALLLEHGTDVNARDFHRRTPLHFAMALGKTNNQGLQQLLEHGADMRARDYSDLAPLDYCAVSGYFDDFIRQLQEMQPDAIDAVDQSFVDRKDTSVTSRASVRDLQDIVLEHFHHRDPTRYVPGAAGEKLEHQNLETRAAEQFHSDMAEMAADQDMTLEDFLDTWTD